MRRLITFVSTFLRGALKECPRDFYGRMQFRPPHNQLVTQGEILTIMHPTEVAAGYDLLAEHWQSEDFDLKNGMDALRRALTFCQEGRYALDVGCGCSGRFIDTLCSAGFTPQGVDLSSQMIRLAKLRHPHVTFHTQDICTWLLPRQYDFICAWDSLWHVPLTEQANVLNKLMAHLSPGGVCLFSMGGLDQPHEKQDAVMGPKMYYSTLGIPQTLTLITQSDCVCRHLEYDQHPETHVYVIAQKR